MQKQNDQFSDITQVIRDALGARLAPSAVTFMDILADDILFEFPYAPPNGVKSVKGKTELAEYLSKIDGTISVESMTLERCILEDSTNSAVLEISCRGFNPQTGHRYDQRYVSVLTLSDGHIAIYRDYWNPLVIITSAKGEAALNEFLS